MDIPILYEDDDVLVADKPAGIIVFQETNTKKQDTNTLIDVLIEQRPELKTAGEALRYGIVHRLDKDTSGLLLVAKTTEALIFLQKQVKNREVFKKYIALATGVIKEERGRIHTLMGRSPADPRKQKAYPLEETDKARLREAITEYQVVKRFEQYTLLEIQLKTGRKHQIRAHLAYIHHPVAGDKVYGFKDSPTPEGLERQFLHASYLKLKLLNGKVEEFTSELPNDLQHILQQLP